MKFIFSCSNWYLTRSKTHSWDINWTLEDKFHISARPCIILYIHVHVVWWNLYCFQIFKPVWFVFSFVILCYLKQRRTKPYWCEKHLNPKTFHVQYNVDFLGVGVYNVVLINLQRKGIECEVLWTALIDSKYS